MTQHVRTSYRSHRKTAWGLALLLVAATATIAIPFASGAGGGPPKTLKFTPNGQPPVAFQKSPPATTASVAVAVYSGSNVQNSQGQEPSLSATGAGTIEDFVVDGPDYDGVTKFWTWSVTPTSTADEGLYNFVAKLGTLDAATSDQFRVAQFVCPPSCNATSNGAKGVGKLTIANTLQSPVALDFEVDPAWEPLGCNGDTLGQTWNRLFYEDANLNKVYFPAVALNFTWGNQMLQVTYMVRNSEWILTNAARGNNDIEFCAEARHQFFLAKNGYPPPPSTNTGEPFDGKYGPATWDEDTEMFSGVLKTVSNPSKVKTTGKTSPAVCGRGNQDIDGETWRTWTVCIPYDWDYRFG